jgi:hypothetical protein
MLTCTLAPERLCVAGLCSTFWASIGEVTGGCTQALSSFVEGLSGSNRSYWLVVHPGELDARLCDPGRGHARSHHPVLGWQCGLPACAADTVAGHARDQSRVGRGAQQVPGAGAAVGCTCVSVC